MSGSTLAKRQKRSNLWIVTAYCVTVAVGGFLFGFDSAVINGTVTALQAEFGSSSIGTGFSVASMLLGCAAGALLAGPLADRWGRRPILIGAALAFLLSALGSGWSSSSGEFIFYRLLGGLAVGAASVIAPAYIAEVAPPRWRGRLGALQQMAIVLGIFVALLSNFGIAKVAGGVEAVWLGGWHAWSWMFWVEAIPSFLYLGLLLFVPESPRFLVGKGRLAEAEKILLCINDPDTAKGTLRAIRESLAGETTSRSLRHLFRPGRWRLLPVVWIGVGLAALQQLSGINVVFYYGSVLWQAAGFSESDALLINVVSGAINITATVVAMLLVDKIGRKPLLLAGGAIMTVALGSIALVFAFAVEGGTGAMTLSSAAAWVALLGAHLYVFAFGTTWGPCVWVVLSELFPNHLRGSAMAVSTFMLWMVNFAITMTFPPLLAHLGLTGAYVIYTSFAAMSVVFVMRFIRESKGRTLEEASD